MLITSGLPDSIIKIIKPTNMVLCDQGLLSKCLHGMTQNNNENFYNVLRNALPKGTFVEMETLLLGAYVAVLLFNSGYLGLLPVFQTLGIEIGEETMKNYIGIDCERIKNSKRHSLPEAKIARKKRKAAKKSKLLKTEVKKGARYKCGEF